MGCRASFTFKLYVRLNIRYIPFEEIDRLKYDSCVHYANTGLPYGYSWYLKAVNAEYDILVEDDYSSVMPLTFNRKIPTQKQLIQPFVAQRLGIMSVNILSQKRVEAFLDAIPKSFTYADININGQITSSQHDIRTQELPNYELLLAGRTYEDIRKGYSKGLKWQVNKVHKSETVFTSNISPERFIEGLKTHVGPKVSSLQERDYFTILRVMYQAMHRGLGFFSGAELNGELIAASFFISSHGRLIYLFSFSNTRGREIGAMSAVIDMVIRQNAGRPVILDFEGSKIDGIAKFFRSFGSINVPYTQLQFNRMPWPLKLLKQ